MAEKKPETVPPVKTTASKSKKKSPDKQAAATKKATVKKKTTKSTKSAAATIKKSSPSKTGATVKKTKSVRTTKSKPKSTATEKKGSTAVTKTASEAKEKSTQMKPPVIESPSEPLSVEAVDTVKPGKTDNSAEEEAPAAPSFDSGAVYAPPLPEHRPDPIGKAIKYAIGGFVILVALIVGTSIQNMNKYFLVASHGAVEIWKGRFSPMGRERIVIMPGVQPPKQLNKVYTREEVYPLAFKHYIDKADALLDVPGSPDFIGVKSYLNRALSFALTAQLRATANAKIDSIDRMTLLYKADVAASKGTLAGLKIAVEYLDQAAARGPDEIEANLIERKLDSIRKQMDLFYPGQPKTVPQASPPAAETVKKVAPEIQQTAPVETTPEEKSP